MYAYVHCNVVKTIQIGGGREGETEVSRIATGDDCLLVVSNAHAQMSGGMAHSLLTAFNLFCQKKNII